MQVHVVLGNFDEATEVFEAFASGNDAVAYANKLEQQHPTDGYYVKTMRLHDKDVDVLALP